jgi:hypothetical protein
MRECGLGSCVGHVALGIVLTLTAMFAVAFYAERRQPPLRVKP